MSKNARSQLPVLLTRWRNRLRYVLAAPFVYRNWWDVFRAKNRSKPTVLVLRNGIKYLIRRHTTDLAIINEASILNPYLAPGYLTVPPNGTVVDVGANIGDFTMQASRLCPDGLVYAIEPMAANCDSMRQQVELNQAGNVRIVQLALGAEEGELELHEAGVQSSAYFGEGKIERVRMTTLSSFMCEHDIAFIDLLKLDCEGAEWDILPAAEDILARVRQLCLEYHNGKLNSEWLEGWLKKNGYTVFRTSEPWNGLLWAWRPSS